jgi:hypothetical protein
MPRQRPKRAPLRHVLVVPLVLVIGTAIATGTQARAMGNQRTSHGWGDLRHGSDAITVDGETARARLGDPGVAPDSAREVLDLPGALVARTQPPRDLGQYRRGAMSGTSQPLFLRRGSSGQLLLQGRFGRDQTGRRSGDLAVRYHDRFHDQPVQFGLSGGLRDGSSTYPDQHSVGAEFRTVPLELRVQLFDDLIDDRVAPGGTTDRMLDGYDVEVGARLPVVRWAWLKANRFWNITADGDEAEPSDSFSLRLAPLAPLEIETGSSSHGDERSWFAQLRLRFRLGAVP